MSAIKKSPGTLPGYLPDHAAPNGLGYEFYESNKIEGEKAIAAARVLTRAEVKRRLLKRIKNLKGGARKA